MTMLVPRETLGEGDGRGLPPHSVRENCVRESADGSSPSSYVDCVRLLTWFVEKKSGHLQDVYWKRISNSLLRAVQSYLPDMFTGASTTDRQPFLAMCENFCKGPFNAHAVMLLLTSEILWNHDLRICNKRIHLLPLKITSKNSVCLFCEFVSLHYHFILYDLIHKVFSVIAGNSRKITLVWEHSSNALWLLCSF